MDKEMKMEKMADKGRGGDSVMAHLSPGEIVIPVELALKLEPMLTKEFEAAKMNFAEFVVGHKSNKINPETSHPEFFSLSSFNPVKAVSNLWSSATSVVGDVLEGLGILQKPPEYSGPSQEQIDAENAAIQRMKDAEAQSKAEQAAMEEENRAVQAEIAKLQEDTAKAQTEAEAKSKQIKGESDVIQRESAERRLSRLRARKRSTNRPMLSSGVSLNSGG